MKAADKVLNITEVGPRDGLQNQSLTIPTKNKIEFVNALSRTGLTAIEVTAFVHPHWVPKLADAEEVMIGIDRVEGVRYSALVPNERGWVRANQCAVDEIAVLSSASETFSQKNTNASIKDSLKTTKSIVESALNQGVNIRGYISCAYGCPYENEVSIDTVQMLVKQLIDIGVQQIALSDTIGVANPELIKRIFDALDGILTPEDAVLHLHDTRGTALQCVATALDCGVTNFDSSSGGLGGCPYAPGAAGNLATEDLIDFANERGIQTGISLSGIVEASAKIEPLLECALPSAIYQSLHDRNR